MATKPPVRKPSTLRRPGSGGAPRPGSAGVKASTSKTTDLKPPVCPSAAEFLKKKKKMEPAEAPKKAYENPAFSIPLTKVHINPLQELKKTIRRNKPQNEDTKELKKVVASLKGVTDITVAEFIGLVAPYTGDNGETMRKVVTDDMNSFRSMARKIYDTMIQDVSDVLTNQHIQLREYEEERTTLYTERMMRAINEIFSYAPNFDFDAYYQDKKGYLSLLFPIPRLVEADSEEAEMHRRQQAFHRLNWLRTEGDRLAAENDRLHKRLKELKIEQTQEIKEAERRAKEADAKRQALEAQEEEMQKQLETLTDRVEETMIDTEAALRMTQDEVNITTTAEKKTSKGPAKRKMKKKPEWVSETAAEIDEIAIEENVIADGGQVPPENVGGVIKKVRSKASRVRVTTPERKPPSGQERSPFHFSPIKTPPERSQAPEQRSPFHYSPIKSPPAVRVQEPETTTAGTPELHTTRLRSEKVTVRQLGPQPRGLLVPPAGGGGMTPGASQPGVSGITPTYRGIPGGTPQAPPRRGPVPGTKPTHSKLQMPSTPRPPDTRRGRASAPKDTWGGFG